MISRTQVELTIKLNNRSNKIVCHVLPLYSSQMGCDIILSEKSMNEFGFILSDGKNDSESY